MKRTIFTKVTLCMIGFFLSTHLIAQNTVTGIISSESGEPLIGANVLVKGTTDGATSEFDGSYSITTTEDFPLTLVFSFTGYSTTEMQINSSSTGVNVQLEEGLLIGQDVVVSASRKREKVQEAPASVSILTARTLESSPQVDPTRNLMNVPGIHVQQQSAHRINIQMRGDGGIFGSASFPIKDYRSLIGPGLGTFQTELAGVSNIDLERIEVVRGAGSALYGPGVTAGVVHFITKSPIDYPGTSVQVYGGEMNTFGAALRQAGTNSNKTFGYKLNVQVNRGDEFTLDGSEGTFDASGNFTGQFDKFQSTIIQPAITNQVVDLTKPGATLLNLETRSDGNVMQDFYKSFTTDLTLEFRPQDDLNIVLAGGHNRGSAVFYNDLGEGLAQSTEVWGQARIQKGGFFAQTYYVDNDGGSQDRPTFLYQTGNRSPVGRKQFEAQLQYNFGIPTFLDADFTVGFDYRLTKADTENLVYGRNEDDDDYSIVGTYIQGKFALGEYLDFVGALRYDQFNFIDEGEISPRAGLVLKASESHTFRLTYNHATSTPTGLEWNIDFPVNAPVPGFLDFWLAGQRGIHDFSGATMIEFLNQNIVAAGINAATGIDINQLLLFASVLPDELPASLLGTGGLSNEFVHGLASAGLLQQMTANGLGALIPLVQPILANGPTGNNGVFIGVNPFEAPTSPNFINNSLVNTIQGVTGSSKTWEFGYKGLFGNKFGVSWDIYRITERGGSDFTAISPFISLQNFDVTPYNALAQQIAGALIGAGVPAASATALVAAYAGAAQLIPNYYATGAVESSLVPQDDGILHVAAGYRIFDAPYTRWGSDLALEYYFNNNLSIFGNYSWLNDNQFERSQGDGSAPFTTFVNFPKDKYRIGLTYTPSSGFRGNIAFQHDGEFTANTGQFAGPVQSRSIVDAAIGYRINSNVAFDITATNLFDNEYRAYPNMPMIGRRVLAKLTFDIGTVADKR